jgi:micrococcal nuclease
MKTIAAVAILCTLPLLGADSIPSAQAKDHVGETGTVCGRVVDARYLEEGSHVTFLNFDRPFPNHTFTAFIPADSRSKFDAPEKSLKDKDVCVTGKIQDYHGKPEIIVTGPEQLK